MAFGIATIDWSLSRLTLNRFPSLLAFKTLRIKSCLVPSALLSLRQDNRAEGTKELGDIWVTKGVKSQILVRRSSLTAEHRNASGTPAQHYDITLIHQHRVPTAKASGVVINGNSFDRKDYLNLWGSRTIIPSDAGKSCFWIKHMSSEISSIQNATERCLKWGPQWLFYRTSFFLIKRYMLQLLGGRHK